MPIESVHFGEYRFMGKDRPALFIEYNCLYKFKKFTLVLFIYGSKVYWLETSKKKEQLKEARELFADPEANWKIMELIENKVWNNYLEYVVKTIASKLCIF